jgi:signal peptidase I
MEARSTAHAIAADANTRDPAARVRLALNGAIRLLIQAAVFIALVSLFFFRVPQVEGRSMLPNIEGGNHVLINTLAYGIALDPWVLTSNPIDRGDIVAF